MNSRRTRTSDKLFEELVLGMMNIALDFVVVILAVCACECYIYNNQLIRPLFSEIHVFVSVFSERELTFMFAIYAIARPSVVCLSVVCRL